MTTHTPLSKEERAAIRARGINAMVMRPTGVLLRALDTIDAMEAELSETRGLYLARDTEAQAAYEARVLAEADRTALLEVVRAARRAGYEYDHPATGDGDLVAKMRALNDALAGLPEHLKNEAKG